MIDKDVIVIGAGPAGLAASEALAAAGLAVLMLDEQPEAGGQVYRGIDSSRLAASGVLDEDYWVGRALTQAPALARVEIAYQAKVWHVAEGNEVSYLQAGLAQTARGKFLVIATGARERPVAIPGWTLPGVMTAGAAQILLKTAAVTADDAVFAGSGPLLYLIAAQYLAAGARISAILDTTPGANYLRAATSLLPCLGDRQLYKGLGMLAKLMRADVPFYRGVTGIQAQGTAALTQVSWTSGGVSRSLACKALFLHQGVVPNIEIPLAAGCAWVWSEQRLCWEITVDEHGASSVPAVFVVGDGARVFGAKAAALSGKLAAARIAALLGVNAIASQDAPLHRLRTRELRLRRFLDRLYRPAEASVLAADPQTIVCRCENLSIQDLTSTVPEAHADLNFVKSASRCGMGPCQGRQCSHSTALLARRADPELHQPVPLRPRSPLAPLSLQELACFKDVA
jgi:NADPH-dependent 2,4-dienoyl-CoA reductase/sulfur reductase-like enzyme